MTKEWEITQEKNPARRYLMHDRQHLFHLQYTTKIYAEDVIVTGKGALVRMTAQVLWSLGTSASVQKQILGHTGNFKCTYNALLALTRLWH